MKPNPVSSVDLLVETSALVPEAVSVVASVATPVLLVAKSMSQTFVSSPNPRFAKVWQALLTL